MPMPLAPVAQKAPDGLALEETLRRRRRIHGAIVGIHVRLLVFSETKRGCHAHGFAWACGAQHAHAKPWAWHPATRFRCLTTNSRDAKALRSGARTESTQLHGILSALRCAMPSRRG